MDRVRFGRALGAGAREAARAVMKAADAAAAPNPTPPAPRAAAPAAGPKVMKAAIAGRVEQAKATSAGVKRGSKRFGAAMWTPLAKAGSVLWLEVMGVLFGLFATAAGIGVWHERANFNAAGPPLHRAWFAAFMLAVFGYFTVSSYVRAAKRGKS